MQYSIDSFNTNGTPEKSQVNYSLILLNYDTLFCQFCTNSRASSDIEAILARDSTCRPFFSSSAPPP